jgi:predicted nucleic acid-binding protein
VDTLVIDASIAIKWVVEEDGTPDALRLRQRAKLIAPELLAAECANILWKKVQRHELSRDEAFLAARLLQAANIEFPPTHHLLEAATRIAVELDHPAYDCLYIALAAEQDCRFVTADGHLVRKAADGPRRRFAGRAVGLAQAARELDKSTAP